MQKENIKKSIIAGLFSTITIGVLTLLTYKTQLGMFLIASFGSSMVLLYGYPLSWSRLLQLRGRIDSLTRKNRQST